MAGQRRVIAPLGRPGDAISPVHCGSRMGADVPKRDGTARHATDAQGRRIWTERTVADAMSGAGYGGNGRAADSSSAGSGFKSLTAHHPEVPAAPHATGAFVYPAAYKSGRIEPGKSHYADTMGAARHPVLVESSARRCDLGFQAACWCSLVSPESTVLRWIRSAGVGTWTTFGALGACGAHEEPGQAHRALHVEEIRGRQRLCVSAQGPPSPGAASARRARPGPADVPAASAGATSPRPSSYATAATFPAPRSGSRTAPSARDGRGRDHSPLRPRHFRLRVPTAQDHHLVPQREYPRVLGRRRTGKRHQPGQHRDQQPADQADAHGLLVMAAIKPQVKRMAEYSTSAGTRRTPPSTTSPGRDRWGLARAGRGGHRRAYGRASSRTTPYWISFSARGTPRAGCGSCAADRR
jgi:hypothetical protein